MGAVVVVMEAAEHGTRGDFAGELVHRTIDIQRCPVGASLSQTLMRASAIEVAAVLVENALQVVLVENQTVIETLSSK